MVVYYNRMWRIIKTFLINLYLKIKCSLCCKSNCSLEVGNPNPIDDDKEQ